MSGVGGRRIVGSVRSFVEGKAGKVLCMWWNTQRLRSSLDFVVVDVLFFFFGNES